MFSTNILLRTHSNYNLVLAGLLELQPFFVCQLLVRETNRLSNRIYVKYR